MDDLIYIDLVSMRALPYVSTNSCARRVSFVSLKRFDFALRHNRRPITTPILRKRTNSALSDEAHIRPVGLGIDDGWNFRWTQR